MRKPTAVWMAAVAAVVLLVVFAGTRAAGVFYRRSAAPVYSTAVATYGTLEVSVSGTGTLRAGAQQNAVSGSSGRVETVLVRAGEEVEAGRVLTVLSSDAMADQVAQARITVRQAEMDLEAMLMPSETLATEADVAAAQAAVEAARVALDRARDNLEGLEVKAPFPGRVSGLTCRAGDTLPPGAPLFTLASHDRLTALLSVSENSVGRLRLGDPATVTVSATARELRGNVSSIAAQGGPGPRGGVFYQVMVILQDEDPAARGGMTVSASFQTSEGGAITATAEGVLAYERLQNVSTPTGGKVTTVLAQEGQIVASGQTVISLENPEVRVAAFKAEVDLARARDALKQLTDPGPPAFTQAQIEKQRLRVEDASLRLAALERQLNDLTVRAAFSGSVTDVLISPGELVTTGQRLLSVADLSTATAVITVDELQVGGLSMGQPASVRIDALPGEVFEGTVESLSLEGLVRDGATSYSVRVSLIPDERMRVGMSLSVSILVALRENTLLVPVEAVYGSGRDAAVRVIVDGQPVARSVVAGLSNNVFIEILEGLAEGDHVVTGTLEPSLSPFQRHSRHTPAGTGSPA